MLREKMKNLKKYKVVIVCTILLLIIFLQYIPWPVDKSIQLVQYQNNNLSYEQPLSIQIEGKYYRSLFKDDLFKGSINLNNYDFTEEWHTVDIVFNDRYGILRYIKLNNTPLGDWSIDSKTLGIILAIPGFDNFSILFDGGSNSNPSLRSSENTLFISYPANNRKEALNILEKLSSRSELVSDFEWN